MKTELKELKKEGEFDYDYLNDILFFKVKEREYAKSIEFDRFVVDVDEENFIVGMQIFDASEYFKISKESIRNIRSWQFQAEVEENRLEIRLTFQTTYRNKTIERMPIITQPLEQPLPNSKMISIIPA